MIVSSRLFIGPEKRAPSGVFHSFTAKKRIPVKSKKKTNLPLVVPNCPAAGRRVIEVTAQCPKAKQMFSIPPSFVILPWKQEFKTWEIIRIHEPHKGTHTAEDDKQHGVREWLH